MLQKDIREKIVIGIQQYWSLLADETQDCSTSEQISVCVRYVNNNVVHEDFMGFVETDKMDAQTITDKLVACLTSWNLDMNNLVGQGYDGAAVMSSGKNGVLAKIRALYENAVYVHCRSHVLALAISASCKQIPAIRNLFDSVERITWFLGGSAMRKNVFVNVAAGNQNNDLQELLLIDEDDMEASNSTIQQGSNRRKIPKFCSTRWTARIDTLAALIAQYQCVLESLEGIAKQSSGDARNDARSYCRLLTDSQFIVSLVVAQFVLSYCARVTKSLQAVSCDLGKAYRDVILSKDAIAKARSEVTWNKLCGRIECIANATGIGIVKPRTACIQQHRANAKLNENQPPREYYRINVFYPFIDHVVQELETRFSSEPSTLLAAEVLVPYYHDQLNAVKISYIKEYYGKFLQRGENFDAEKDKWVIMYRDIPRDQRPKTASDSLSACSQEYFPAVHIILTIFLTTPVGSVACERSFSALRRLKLWTRSSMAQDRLSGLGMLLVHRDNVDLVPKPDEIFSRKSNWRQ